MNTKGFTLVEVLVALAIVGMAGISIYTVMNQSIYVMDIMKRRLMLVQYGYERTLMEIANPDTVLDSSREIDDEIITYEGDTQDTPTPLLLIKTSTTKGYGTNIVFYYYVSEVVE